MGQDIPCMKHTAVATPVALYNNAWLITLNVPFNLKARTHRDEFRARYSQTFNASWLNKGRQCECAQRRKKTANYPTNEIGAFAHVSGAAEVTVKHNLRALKHKTVLLSTYTFSHSTEHNFFIVGAAGAGASGAWNIHVFFVWFLTSALILALFFWVTSECQKRKVAQRMFTRLVVQRKSLGCEHKKRAENTLANNVCRYRPGVYGP